MDSFLHRNLSQTEVAQVDEDLARFCYAEGLPFRALASPWLRKAIGRLNPSWLELTRLTEWTYSMLDDQHEHVSRDMMNQISSAFAITLLSDGWSGVQKKHVLNILLAAPEPYFIDNIFTNADIFEPIIKEHGVRAFVSDNASVMRKTWRILRERIPSLWTYGCAPHGFNLHTKDIINLDEFRTTNADCQKIAVYFSNNKQAGGLATLQTIQDRLGVKGSIDKGCKTRWGSQIDCAKDLVKHKQALVLTVTDQSFSTSKDNAKEVSALCRGDEFWARVGIFLRVLEPLRFFLKVLQSDTATVADVYAQCVAVHAAQSALPQHLFTVANTKEDLMRLLQERMNFIIHPLHFVAYSFHPRYAKGTSLDNHIVTHYVFTLAADALGEHDRSSLRQELEFFFGPFQTAPVFGSAFDGENSLLDDPVNWVTAHLTKKCPILSKLLCIIFSLAPSTAGAERNWSIQDFIVSKRRNRLTDARGTELVAIYWNLRALETAFKAAEIGRKRKFEGIHGDDNGRLDGDDDALLIGESDEGVIDWQYSEQYSRFVKPCPHPLLAGINVGDTMGPLVLER
ncbi:hypothetical protein KFE25_005363 [Diacronema lutheri]|uniref:HAT C-terminal dimerisation domain-containing protein n=1 Tax=Diacronema lutheri TaxID=2081491 RepID=A0A8J5XJH1_DIALT|nr:hypothetical protein KFE25_005363 [Diacronema lutheri]